MKAIAVIPGTTTPRLVERPEPNIAAPDEVKLRVLRVGMTKRVYTSLQVFMEVNSAAFTVAGGRGLFCPHG